MKTRKALFLLVLMCSLFIVGNAYALTPYRVTNQSGLNMREQTNTSSKIVTTMKYNDMVIVSSTTPTKNSICRSGWYKAQYNGKTGYVCSKYLSNSKITVKVNSKTKVNIRNGAGTSFDVYTKFKDNKLITLASSTKETGAGCSAGWYKISYNGSFKYICSSFVDSLNNNSSVIVSSQSGINIYDNVNYTTKIDTLKYMEAATKYDANTFKSSKCSAGLYKILFKGYARYVCSSYVLTTNQYGMTTDSVNMRSNYNTTSDIITELENNTNIVLYTNTKYKDTTNCTDGWYKIKLNGKAGYVCSTYVSLKSASINSSSTTSSGKKITTIATASGNYYTINKWTYRINEDYAYARTSPTGSVKDTLYLGTELDYLGTSSATDGCSEGWYKVKYYTNRTGYICKRYVDKYSDVTYSNSTYCTTLKNKGFPASYCPYLSYLHKKHPTWIFKADKTGVNFLSAVNGESKKNYTQITESPYLVSWTISEVGGWRTASDAYIAFMIDARNYLNEKNVFAFEDLSYDKTNHTATSVRSIVKGTYLDTDIYAGYFIEAAKKYNVSPIHLAARVKQEGGTDITYTSVSGTSSSKWNVTSSAYVCGDSTFGSVSGSKFKIKSGVIANVRKGAGTNYSTLKYSNGRYITANKRDDLILLRSYKLNRVTKNSVNVRSGAGTNYSGEMLNKGTFVSLVDTKKYTGTGCSAGWYKINYGSGKRYICSSYVEPLTGCSDGWYWVKVNKSLYGVYNYYNIGAYGDDPVIRGLAAAAGYIDTLEGTPWTTRKNAIISGAQFIADTYINKGQNTLFYQKFNVGPNNYYNKYTHQYMTNILAPASEGLSTYRSYVKLGIISKNLTFSIPVYNNMPTQMTTHPIVK